MSKQRWVWLEVTLLGAIDKAVHRYYIPERIVSHIPFYDNQIKEKLESNESDDEPIIRDTTPRNLKKLSKAIRFLTSGHLTPLNTSTADWDKALDSLVSLWSFGLMLSITGLCAAVISHIEHSKALSPRVFFTFARRFYAKSPDNSNIKASSIGCMIKRKLTYFMPYLEESMTIDELSSEGGILGKQLIEVLLEDRDDLSKSRH